MTKSGFRISWPTMFVGLLATLCVVLPEFAVARQEQAQDIVGVWLSADHLKIAMIRHGDVYDGKLLYSPRAVEKDGITFKKDVNNPDPSLRSRSLKGILLVRGLHWHDGAWSGGTIYVIWSGKTYSCRAQLIDGKLRLRVYLGIPLLGKTIVLTRLSAPKP